MCSWQRGKGYWKSPSFHDAMIERIRSIKIEAVCGLYDHSNEYTVFSCNVVQKQLCVDCRNSRITEDSDGCIVTLTRWFICLNNKVIAKGSIFRAVLLVFDWHILSVKWVKRNEFQLFFFEKCSLKYLSELSDMCHQKFFMVGTSSKVHLSWIIWPQMEEIALGRAETACNNKNQPR